MHDMTFRYLRDGPKDDKFYLRHREHAIKTWDDEISRHVRCRQEVCEALTLQLLLADNIMHNIVFIGYILKQMNLD